MTTATVGEAEYTGTDVLIKYVGSKVPTSLLGYVGCQLKSASSLNRGSKLRGVIGCVKATMEARNRHPETLIPSYLNKVVFVSHVELISRAPTFTKRYFVPKSHTFPSTTRAHTISSLAVPLMRSFIIFLAKII